MGFIKSRNRVGGDEQGPFFMMIHLLVIMLNEFMGGTISLGELLGINRKPNFEEFCIFLATLEVYGSGYLDDVDYLKYNKRNE